MCAEPGGPPAAKRVTRGGLATGEIGVHSPNEQNSPVSVSLMWVKAEGVCLVVWLVPGSQLRAKLANHS